MTTTVTKVLEGTVQIRNSNNRLQLRFSHEGKRHYLSLGLPDTKENRKAAQAKARLIESDIAYDRFDISKDKRSEVLTAQSLSQLDKLWDKFQFKRIPLEQVSLRCLTLTLDLGLTSIYYLRG